MRSRRPSSEVKGHGNKTDKVAMRFNASQDINFDLKGGIEGRTISVRPSKDGDGDMELSIGSRGRTPAPAAVAPSSRPTLVQGREKSRRRYSYIEGQEGVMEVDRAKVGQASRGTSQYRNETRGGVVQVERGKSAGGRTTSTYYRSGPARPLQRVNTGESIREEGEFDEPRVVRERVRMTSRSRRSSRYRE